MIQLPHSRVRTLALTGPGNLTTWYPLFASSLANLARHSAITSTPLLRARKPRSQEFWSCRSSGGKHLWPGTNTGESTASRVELNGRSGSFLDQNALNEEPLRDVPEEKRSLTNNLASVRFRVTRSEIPRREIDAPNRENQRQFRMPM
jgi:hypothetical protein